MPVEHFKSKEAYRKSMAYRHMHNIPFTAEKVVVGGKEHKVKHSGRERAAIDKKQREETAKYSGSASSYKHSRPVRKIVRRSFNA